MKLNLSTHRRFRRIIANTLCIFAILAIAFPVTAAAQATPASPFVGTWQAKDMDGSSIRLTIGGPSNGPFRITWTESYLSFCNREAGLVHGTGWLNESDPNLLEADLHAVCFTTGVSMDFHLVWRYHSALDTLSSRYDNGIVLIWRHPGRLPVPPPTLNLRVSYGDDWVESFYEGGHMAWVTVTESDGVTVKATSELVTEPKDYWNGETGFQSLDTVWFDVEKNQMNQPPDIQPNDWVFGWVDNGASAQVQIGDISGKIDLDADSIQGTIMASWFTNPVQVECFDWGSGNETPYANRDGGSVLPDGSQSYSCSWAGEWDIQRGQNVGVGYFGSDGNWVANSFRISDARIVASAVGDWFWTTDFQRNSPLVLSIYESSAPDAALLWTGNKNTNESGFAFVEFSDTSIDLAPGNYVTVSDGTTEKGIVLQWITVNVFDVNQDFMTGIAPAGSEVWVAAGPQDWQKGMFVEADAITGEWKADFTTIPFDITEEMRGWSYAQLFDEDGDMNEADPPPPHPASVIFAHPAYEVVEGSNWMPGTEVTLKIDHPANEEGIDYSDTQIVSEDTWLHFNLNDFDLQAGDIITMTDGQYSQTMVVSTLRVTGFYLDTHTLFGVGDPNSEAFIADNGMPVPIDDGGNWSVSFDALLPGSWWTMIQAYPDGNEMRETFRTPVPVIFAQPAYNVIEGHEWIPGSEVTITIDDPSNGAGADYTQTAVASGNINYLYDTGVHFDLAFDLQAGHIITMTDGHFTRTMVVNTLRVTGFNLDSHTISGVGDPGSEFTIADNGMSVSVNDEGKWSVTNDELTPGSWWTILQKYPDGNEMRETFRAPVPVIFAHPAYNVIEGHEWTPGGEVTITIDDPMTAESPDYTQTATASGNINYLYDTGVHFDLGFDLQAGHIITMTDGQYTQTMTVSTLRVTGFDVATHSVFGVGDPGSEFKIIDNGITVQVDAEGNWSATFDGLVSGTWWTIIQKYLDGNELRETFQVP